LDTKTRSIACRFFSPDGRALATASDDQTVKLWNAASGQCKSTLVGHSDRVVAAIFTSDGRRIVSGAHNGHDADVWSLVVSPDGRTLFSGGNDRLVHVWDLASQTEIATLEGHSGVIRKVCLSADGSILATCADTASGGSEVFLWRAIRAKAAPDRP
jgi:WD40 repeat protein